MGHARVGAYNPVACGLQIDAATDSAKRAGSQLLRHRRIRSQASALSLPGGQLRTHAGVVVGRKNFTMCCSDVNTIMHSMT